jgi:hypothetical protein
MKDSKPIGGMTVDEYIIYNKGYTVGLEIGEAVAEERIIKRLEEEREKHIPWCGDIQPCAKCNQTVGLETALALIKGEK